MNEAECLVELGQRIAQERIHAGMTQQTLANKAAISLATLSKAERGYPMTTSTLYRILSVFNRSPALPDILPEPVIDPIALRKLKQRRQRVRD